MFTEEKKSAYDAIMESYTEITNQKEQEPFFKEAELTFLRGVTTLMLLDENLVDEMIANYKEPNKVFEIWNRISDDHPSRLYLNQIWNIPPSIRSSVIIGAMLTVFQFKDILNQLN